MFKQRLADSWAVRFDPGSVLIWKDVHGTRCVRPSTSTQRLAGSWLNRFDRGSGLMLKDVRGTDLALGGRVWPRVVVSDTPAKTLQYRTGPLLWLCFYEYARQQGRKGGEGIG